MDIVRKKDATFYHTDVIVGIDYIQVLRIGNQFWLLNGFACSIIDDNHIVAWYWIRDFRVVIMYVVNDADNVWRETVERINEILFEEIWLRNRIEVNVIGEFEGSDEVMIPTEYWFEWLQTYFR